VTHLRRMHWRSDACQQTALDTAHRTVSSISTANEASVDGGLAVVPFLVLRALQRCRPWVPGLWSRSASGYGVIQRLARVVSVREAASLKRNGSRFDAQYSDYRERRLGRSVRPKEAAAVVGASVKEDLEEASLAGYPKPGTLVASRGAAADAGLQLKTGLSNFGLGNAGWGEEVWGCAGSHSQPFASVRTVCEKNT